MDEPCTCGDAADEHDPDTMACDVCDCIHYERAGWPEDEA